MFLLDSLAVGQKIDGGVDERVVLFVKLQEGQTLSKELEQRIKNEIRSKRSPRHVPARVSSPLQTAAMYCKGLRFIPDDPQVIQVPDIPYTLNGKRVEVLVKKVSHTASDWY